MSREFRKQIFLGNGDFSKAECERFHKRLDEALSILSGLQQPDHPESEEHARQCDYHRTAAEAELDDCLLDITFALGLDGNESRIIRRSFKGLRAKEQRKVLQDLILEHAYYAAVQGYKLNETLNELNEQELNKLSDRDTHREALLCETQGERDNLKYQLKQLQNGIALFSVCSDPWARDIVDVIEQSDSKCMERVYNRNTEYGQLKVALEKIHELVGRGKGHNTINETLSCILSGIISTKMDHDEEVAELKAEIERLKNEDKISCDEE